MKNVKRLMSALLAFTLIIVPLVGSAQSSEALISEADKGEYITFRGKIEEVNIKENKGSIRVKNDDGEELIFHITDEVFVTDMRLTKENKIMNLEKGAKVSVFYTKNTPVALSMPGQLTPNVIVVENGDKMVKVDRFDENLLSSDGNLALNVDKGDADKYKGKDLLIFYTITTESLPAQTAPESIIILNEVKSERPELVEPKESDLTPIRFDGKITHVNKDGDKLSIRVKSSDGEELIFHITDDVFVTDMTLTKENKILHLEKDANIVAFYSQNTPVTASIPGQLTPEVVVVKNGDKLVKLDYFNKDLVSSDGKLKLDIEDEKTRKEYRDEKLLVFYKNATKSIPAITRPDLVTVVTERTVEAEEIRLDKVKVNGKDKPMKLYEKSDGTIMLPVRELSEALGYKVKWNGKNKPIEITKGSHWSSVELRKNNYVFARQTPFKLSYAPELVKGQTYVPYDFIKNVLRIEPKLVNGVIEVKE